MSEKKKKDFVDYNENVVADEMQRALSFELEHKTLWLWYVLNSIVMWIAYFIFICTETPIPPAVQVLVVLYFGVMLFCLSLYNIKAANKGALNSFSRYQKNMKGGKYMVAAFNLAVPISCFLQSFDSDLDSPAANYKVFFTTVFLMAAAYEFISSYCVWKNKKVRDSLAADGEESETDDNDDN